MEDGGAPTPGGGCLRAEAYHAGRLICKSAAGCERRIRKVGGVWGGAAPRPYRARSIDQPGKEARNHGGGGDQ
jgi:hypothetical protein